MAQKVKKLCKKCGAVIPQGRSEALPDTQVCVRCSEVIPHWEGDVELDGMDPQDLQRIGLTPERSK